MKKAIFILLLFFCFWNVLAAQVFEALNPPIRDVRDVFIGFEVKNASDNHPEIIFDKLDASAVIHNQVFVKSPDISVLASNGIQIFVNFGDNTTNELVTPNGTITHTYPLA